MINRKLITSDFLALCLITFLSLCNTAVFFNFFPYLQTLGFSSQEAGLLIGIYALTSMVLYGGFSRFITTQNGYRIMVMGLLITTCCGVGYTVATTMVQLVIIRIISGIGLFLTMSSCMTLFVTVIPPGRSGVAFSLYSVAMLLPYSIMPAITELTSGWFSSPVTMYMLTALFLLPTATFAFRRSRRQNQESVVQKAGGHPAMAVSGVAYRRNLLRKPVLFILFINATYFFLFSSLFYFLKGYAMLLEVSNPGYFFTIQMAVMVLLRMFGSRMFDACSKEYLILFALAVTAIGYVLLAIGVGGLLFFCLAILFGVGMGLCIPPLNALMYLHGESQFRGYNANMMLLAMHFGSFVGPYGGSMLIATGGYPIYCYATVALIGIAALVVVQLKKCQPFEGE